MNLSTRGRYATRAMLELARHYGEKPLSSAAIGQTENISARYLQQLLGTLKRAGLVRVNMGPGGGFALAKPPTEITVGKILDAVEGHLALVECVNQGDKFCKRSTKCMTKLIWAEASRALNDFFAKLTLATVLARYEKECVPRRGARQALAAKTSRRRAAR